MTAEHFNKFFCNIADTIDKEFPAYVSTPSWKGASSIHNFNLCLISSNDVLKELLSLTDLPSLDVLNMDRKLLRLSSHIISPSLTAIINRSISSHTVHDMLKRARVTPIFKNGDDDDVNRASDYRPISVIGHIAKILEKLVKKAAYDFFGRY